MIFGPTMMSRTIVILLAGILILIAAGCGGNSSQPAETPTTDPAPPSAPSSPPSPSSPSAPAAPATPNEPEGVALSHPELINPLHLIIFNGKYVAAEMETERLAIFDDLSFTNISHFDPKNIGQDFHHPHFLSLSPWGTLLITNGTGTTIVEIIDLEGNGWREFGGLDISFNSPHGICIDDAGWIYVGDSLNSRIVRFRDMYGTGWEVFGDLDRRIAYARQMVWYKGALWVSNSYEKRTGLNEGAGANVLRISDFSSGKAEIVFEKKDTNITGILPLDNWLYICLWGDYESMIQVDLNTGKITDVKGSHNSLGTPYGIFQDPSSGSIITSYFGSFEANDGGLFKIK
jgi:hypothetical protein